MLSTLKRKMVPAVKRGLGTVDWHRKSIAGSLSIFVYHEVSDNPSPFMDAPNLNVPPRLFAQQMDFIQENFNVISPDQLVEGQFKRPAALVTFDDGMLGYFQNAVPIMTEKKIPSINFLNMETIEGGLSWTGLVTYLCYHDANFQEHITRNGDASLPLNVTLMAPDLVRNYLTTVDMNALEQKVRAFTGTVAGPLDLAAVKNNPYVFFGNHLFNHYSALVLKREDFQRQYSVNQEKISAYPNGRAHFAYPYGRFIHRQNDLLRSLGAQAIYYSSEGINDEVTDHFYNRMSVDSHMTRVEDLLGQIRWLKFRQSRGWHYQGQPDSNY